MKSEMDVMKTGTGYVDYENTLAFVDHGLDYGVMRSLA